MRDINMMTNLAMQTNNKISMYPPIIMTLLRLAFNS